MQCQPTQCNVSSNGYWAHTGGTSSCTHSLNNKPSLTVIFPTAQVVAMVAFALPESNHNLIASRKHSWLSENKLSWLVDSQGITEFGLSLFQATCNPQEQQWQPQPEQHQSIEDSSSWWCTWLLYSRICNPCEFRVGRLLSIKLEWCGGWGIASNMLRARF